MTIHLSKSVVRIVSAIICASVTLISGMPLGAAAPPTSTTGFALQDTVGDHLDVLLDGAVVARYMYAHDVSTPERRVETYKPYLHVLDADGKTLLTKGPGGQFTHHRAIFIGFRKIDFDGKSYDHWHMIGGDMVHQKFLDQTSTPDHATFTAMIQWLDDKGVSFVDEERTIKISRGPAPTRLLIDFKSKLSAPRGNLTFDGDPEHSGVQFRPSNEVDSKKTQYVFPAEHPNAHKDHDYPWVGETFVLGGVEHSVVELNHPDNPHNTLWSAYRDYGRLGAFPKFTVKQGESATLKYAFLINDGPVPNAKVIEAAWDAFAGAKAATPVPPTTTLLSEQPATKPAR